MHRSTNKTTNDGWFHPSDYLTSSALFPSAQSGNKDREEPITLPHYRTKYKYNPKVSYKNWEFPVHQYMAMNEYQATLKAYTMRNNNIYSVEAANNVSKHTVLDWAKKNLKLLPPRVLLVLIGNAECAETILNKSTWVERLQLHIEHNPNQKNIIKVQRYTIICADYPGAHSGTKRYGKRVNLNSADIDNTITSFAETLIDWARLYGTEPAIYYNPSQQQRKKIDLYSRSIGGYVTMRVLNKWNKTPPLLQKKLPFDNVWLERTMSSLSDIASTMGLKWLYRPINYFCSAKDIDLKEFCNTIKQNPLTRFHVLDAKLDDMMRKGARLGEQLQSEYTHSDTPKNLHIHTVDDKGHNDTLSDDTLHDFFQNIITSNVAIGSQSELDVFNSQQENQLFLTQLLHKASQKVRNRYKSFGYTGTKVTVDNVSFVVSKGLAIAVDEENLDSNIILPPAKYKEQLLALLKNYKEKSLKWYTKRDPWTCTLYKGPEKNETTDNFFRRILSTPRLPKNAGLYINDLFSTSNIQPGISRSTYFKIMADKEACALFKLAELHKSPYPYAYTRAILALFKISPHFLHGIWENIKSKQKKYNTSNDYVPDLYNPQPPPPLHNLPRNLLHNGWLQRAIIAAGEYIVKSRNHSFTCHRSENTTRKFIGELLSYAKDKYSKEKRIVLYGEEYCSLNDIISREVKALVEGQRPYEEKRFWGSKIKSGHGEGSRRAIFNKYFPDLDLKL